MDRDLFSILDDPPAVRHSPTSVAAAEAIKEVVPSWQARVMKLIRDAGEYGCTDDELITITGKQGSRPRRIKLVQLGLVRDSGRTRLTAAEHPAAVWVAT